MARRGLDPKDFGQMYRVKPDWEAAHPPPRATLAQVADHIDHVRQVAGVEHVGLGGDFDGTPDVTVGLEDVSTYPALFAELLTRSWTEADCAPARAQPPARPARRRIGRRRIGRR